MAHWRGQGRFAGDDDAWLAIGRETRRRLVAALRVHLPAIAQAFEAHDPARGPLFEQAALEWGPGGGSNVVALAPYFPRYYGVDVSEATLAEASRQAWAEGVRGFTPVHLASDDPRSIVPKVPEPVGFFVSTAVFQHFPSRAYGAEVLAVLHELSAPGALGIVQIRYEDGKARFQAKDADYETQFLTFTAYGLEAFARLVRDTGFTLLEISVTNPGINYANYVMRRNP